MIRPCGYDVGAGSVREGDEALLLDCGDVSPWMYRRCHVDTVYHDGDVCVTLANGEVRTTKWRYVVPLNT